MVIVKSPQKPPVTLSGAAMHGSGGSDRWFGSGWSGHQEAEIISFFMLLTWQPVLLNRFFAHPEPGIGGS
jgi:hypothetical protein